MCVTFVEPPRSYEMTGCDLRGEVGSSGRETNRRRSDDGCRLACVFLLDDDEDGVEGASSVRPVSTETRSSFEITAGSEVALAIAELSPSSTRGVTVGGVTGVWLLGVVLVEPVGVVAAAAPPAPPPPLILLPPPPPSLPILLPPPPPPMEVDGGADASTGSDMAVREAGSVEIRTLPGEALLLLLFERSDRMPNCGGVEDGVLGVEEVAVVVVAVAMGSVGSCAWRSERPPKRAPFLGVEFLELEPSRGVRLPESTTDRGGS